MNFSFAAVWGLFLSVFTIGVIVSRLFKKQIEEDGIETIGTISRVVDDGGTDEIDIHVYARYRTNDGEEVEGVLANAPDSLVPGQRVRVKYHPKWKMNARLVEILKE